MTPALNPRERDKNFLFVFLVRKAIALPIPVDSPANKVRAKASNTLSQVSSMSYFVKDKKVRNGLWIFSDFSEKAAFADAKEEGPANM